MNETLNKIEELIATAEKFRSSYFWQAPTSASARRMVTANLISACERGLSK